MTSFCVYEQNLPSQKTMNGNTTRVNTSTSQQWWHVLTTLLAILKFDAEKFGYIEVFQAYCFRASGKKCRHPAGQKYQSYFRGVHKDQTVSYFTTHGFRGVAKLLFFRDCTTFAQVQHPIVFSAYMKESSTSKTDLVPCNPKKLISNGQASQHARTRLVHNTN